MSFLNWILLGGSAAFAVPLLIHLLNRARFKTVDWGAMHLLESALQVNSRRVQWQSLLLLLLRCSLPILLALCLARPVLTKWRAQGGAGDKSLVLMIDNSLSMEAQEGAQSRFDKAIEEAIRIVRQQSSNTEWSVWSTGGVPTDLIDGTTFDQRMVIGRIQSLKAGAGAMNVAASLKVAAEQLQAMQNANRELLIVSDFQQQDWSSFGVADRQAWKARLEASALQPHVTFLSVASATTGSLENLSIELAEPDSTAHSLVGLGQTVETRVTIHNHGLSAVDEVEVLLRVGDEETGTNLSSRRLSIPADGVAQASFACQFDSAGWRSLSIQVIDPGQVHGDDVVHKCVQVVDAVRVLLVDNQPQAPQWQRTTGFLSLALSPYQATDEQQNLIQVETVAPHEMKTRQLDDFAVVVLANINRLEDTKRLTQFVSSGGGLLIFAGDQIDTDWYNKHLRKNKASEALLPVKFGKIETAPEKTPVHVDSASLQSSSLRIFSQSGGGDLDAIEISKWCELLRDDHQTVQPVSEAAVVDGENTPTEQSDENAKSVASVWLTLDNGQPLLVAQDFGAGCVIQCATSCDQSWSNLPLRTAFVPLVQSLVKYCATRSQVARTAITSESIDLSGLVQSYSRSLQSTPAKQNPPIDFNNLEMEVRGPDGKSRQVSIVVGEHDPNNENQVLPKAVFQHLDYPGVYACSIKPKSSEGKSPESMLTQFAVNLPPAESQLKVLEIAEQQQLRESMSADLVFNASEFDDLLNTRSNGREIWRWLLLGLVLLLFVEIWLQQRITRGAA